MFGMFRRKQTVKTSRDLAQVAEWIAASGAIDATPEQAIKYAPVFMCIRVLAESLGMLPLHLYQRNGERKEKAVSHPLYRVLNIAPNHFQTSQEFREMLVAHLFLSGNFYAFINRTINGVRELLPIHPSKVVVTQNDDMDIVYKITFPNGTIREFISDDIFHVKLMSFDGFTGVTPLTYCRRTIGLGISNENFGARFFENDATPNGILVSENKTLTKEKSKDLRDSWNALLKDDGNHGTAVLSGGLKWLQVSMSALDAQFLETKKLGWSEVAGIFRVPPYMIGALEKTTVGNIEQQAIDFVTHTIMPHAVRIEQRIGFSLLTEKEQATYFAKFNVAALLRGDMASRGAFYRIMFELGAYNSNTIRSFEDMNPRDGGDEYYVALNMGNTAKTHTNNETTSNES